MNIKKILLSTLLATSLIHKVIATPVTDDTLQKVTEHYQNLTNIPTLQAHIDMTLIAFTAAAFNLSSLKNNSTEEELATYSTCVDGIKKLSSFTSHKGLAFIQKKLTAEKESLINQNSSEKFNTIHTMIEDEITRRANVSKP